MRFATCLLHVSKVLRLPRKSEAGSYEVLHLSRKIIFAKLKISCSKMPPLSGNLRPDLLTHLTHACVSCIAPATRHASFQILFKCPTPTIVQETADVAFIIVFFIHMILWKLFSTFRQRQPGPCDILMPFCRKSLAKHSLSRLCYLFAHLHLLSSHSFSSLIFSLQLFSCLTLLTSAFPSVHVVGSLT